MKRNWKISIILLSIFFIIGQSSSAMEATVEQEKKASQIPSLYDIALKKIVEAYNPYNLEAFFKKIEHLPNDLQEAAILAINNYHLNMLAYYLKNIKANAIKKSFMDQLARLTLTGIVLKDTSLFRALKSLIPAQILDNPDLKNKLAQDMLDYFLLLHGTVDSRAVYKKFYLLSWAPGTYQYALPLEKYSIHDSPTLEEAIIIMDLLIIQQKLSDIIKKQPIGSTTFLSKENAIPYLRMIQNLKTFAKELPKTALLKKIENDLETIKMIITFGSGIEEADEAYLGVAQQQN